MRFGVAGQLSALQLVGSSRAGGRVSLPVKPMHTVYAQFRHVSGHPSLDWQNPVPLSKVQILNSLIESLQRTKGETLETPVGLGNDPERAKALIEQYASELHRIVRSAPQAFGGGGEALGLAFNVTA